MQAAGPIWNLGPLALVPVLLVPLSPLTSTCSCGPLWSLFQLLLRSTCWDEDTDPLNRRTQLLINIPMLMHLLTECMNRTLQKVTYFKYPFHVSSFSPPRYSMLLICVDCWNTYYILFNCQQLNLFLQANTRSYNITDWFLDFYMLVCVYILYLDSMIYTV